MFPRPDWTMTGTIDEIKRQLDVRVAQIIQGTPEDIGDLSKMPCCPG